MAACAPSSMSGPGGSPRSAVKDKDRPVIEVAPLANRLLLFSPHNGLSHGVAPITAAAGDWERWSYSLWYADEADEDHA